MPSLLRPIQRWRHKRGFGIHSPFAFRFVTEVLNQKHPFYAYTTLGRDKRSRLAHRLAVSFKATRVMFMGAEAMCEKALSTANSGIETVKSHPDFIIVDASKVDRGACIVALNNWKAHAMIVNASGVFAHQLRHHLQHGMTFTNAHGTIVIAAHPHLPRLDFHVTY